MAVQGGFVAGTLVAALLNLADLLNARWVFGAGCLGAAAANALVGDLRAKLPQLAGRSFLGRRLAVADDFAYTDPIDGSVSTKQGLRLVFDDADETKWKRAMAAQESDL